MPVICGHSGGDWELGARCIRPFENVLLEFSGSDPQSGSVDYAVNVLGADRSVVAEFAKKHSCYVVCPIMTKKDGRYYNSSLLIDRKGSIAGVYHKIHPLKSEILPDQDFKGGGVTPGALNQPVIQTDFGKVGLQICFDANWADGWDNLKRQGAEIVFFSSAFPGGRMLNQYAFKNDFYIVSGTGGDAQE